MLGTNAAKAGQTKPNQLIAGALYRNKDKSGPFLVAADTPSDLLELTRSVLTSRGDFTEIKRADPGLDPDSLELQYMIHSLDSVEVKFPSGGAGTQTSPSGLRTGPWLELPPSVISDTAIQGISDLRKLRLERDNLRELNLKLVQELQALKREMANIKAEKFVSSIAAGSSAIRVIDEVLSQLESNTSLPPEILVSILGSIKMALASYEPTSIKAAANLEAIDKLNGLNSALSMQLKEMEAKLAAKELLEQQSKIDSTQTKKAKKSTRLEGAVAPVSASTGGGVAAPAAAASPLSEELSAAQQQIDFLKLQLLKFEENEATYVAKISQLERDRDAVKAELAEVKPKLQTLTYSSHAAERKVHQANSLLHAKEAELKQALTRAKSAEASIAKLTSENSALSAKLAEALSAKDAEITAAQALHKESVAKLEQSHQAAVKELNDQIAVLKDQLAATPWQELLRLQQATLAQATRAAEASQSAHENSTRILNDVGGVVGGVNTLVSAARPAPTYYAPMPAPFMAAYPAPLAMGVYATQQASSAPESQ